MRAIISIHDDRNEDQEWRLYEQDDHYWLLVPVKPRDYDDGDPAPDQYLDLGRVLDVLAYMLAQPADDGFARELVERVPR